MDHSRQTGRPPRPTPRFRTVDGWGRPAGASASARATRSRFRSGSGTRTASAAAALRERTALAGCAVRRSSRRGRRGGMEKKHATRFVEELPSARDRCRYRILSYAQGSVARSLAQPRYWVVASASMLAINAERRQARTARETRPPRDWTGQALTNAA